MPAIFLVEDNPPDVELFRMALEDACVECDLVVFEDGGEVLEHIANTTFGPDHPPPDLIMLDLNLPKNDGLEILQVIRDTSAMAEVPIVVLSSSSSPRERAKLAAFRIREFLVKPPDLEEYLKIGKVVRDVLAEKAQGLSAPTATA